MNRSQAKIGYARTSTSDQNLDAQIAALRMAGCGMIRTEQKSGATLDGRSELKIILEFIHPGEILVVTRIDRLARSLTDLQTIVTALKNKGAHLAATEQPVDTSVPIRLSPTPTTSRVLPIARVKLGVSGSGDIASNLGGTGRAIREKSLELRKRPRKRKVFTLRDIHPRFVPLPGHSTPRHTYSGCG